MQELVTISTLNGVLYGMLLFLMASGLTLIFSMMGVLNFAHASFYMLGAFFGFQIGQIVGFWPAFIIAPVLVGGIGALVERYALRHVHRHGPVAELLFTFGLAFIIEELVQMVWGKGPADYRVPASLDYPAFTIFSTNYPAYKMFELLTAVGDLRRAVRRAQAHPDRAHHPGLDHPCPTWWRCSATTCRGCSCWCSASAPGLPRSPA